METETATTRKKTGGKHRTMDDEKEWDSKRYTSITSKQTVLIGKEGIEKK